MPTEIGGAEGGSVTSTQEQMHTGTINLQELRAFFIYKMLQACYSPWDKTKLLAPAVPKQGVTGHGSLGFGSISEVHLFPPALVQHLTLPHLDWSCRGYCSSNW